MNVALLLYFPDDDTNPPVYSNAALQVPGYFFDCSAKLAPEYSIDEAVFNQDFKHVVNKCSVTLANNDAILYQKLLNNNNSIVKFKLIEDSNLVFDGIIRANQTFQIKNGLNTFKLDATDISYLLDVMTSFPIVKLNTKIHNPSDNSNSAISYVLTQTLGTYGFDVPTIEAVDTGEVLPVVCAPANTKLSDFLEELFFDYTWQYSFEAGVLKIVQWNTNTSTTVGTIDDIIDGSLKIARKQATEDSVKVNVNFCDTVVTTLLDDGSEKSANGEVWSYFMTVNGSSNLTGLNFVPSNITFQHVWNTVEWVWDWLNSGFKQIEHSKTFSANVVNGVEQTINSQGEIYKVKLTWGDHILKNGVPDPAQWNQIKVSIYLDMPHSATIRRIKVTGQTVSQKAAQTFKSDTPGPKANYKEYNANYIANNPTTGVWGTTPNGSQVAKRLANALQRNIKDNPLTYSFESETRYILGQNYNINVPDIPANAQIPNVNVKVISRKTNVTGLADGTLYKTYNYESFALSRSDLDSSIPHQNDYYAEPVPVPFDLSTVNTDGFDSANSAITQDQLNSSAANVTISGLYVTKDVMGYYNAGTRQMTNYISAYGDFKVGSGTHQVTYDPISDLLSVSGDIAAGGSIKNTAFVSGSNGFILNADGSAEFLNATIRGNSTFGGTLQSTSYVHNTSGWKLDQNGDAELNSVIISSTNQSNTFVAGTSGWRLESGSGNAEFNNVVIRGSSTVGGFTVGSTGIKNNYFNMSNADSRITITDISGNIIDGFGMLAGILIQGSPWDISKPYAVAGGEYVSYNGVIYKSKAISGNTGRTPPNSTYWTVSTDTYSVTQHGFYSRPGNAITMNGDMNYGNGAFQLQNDASVIISQSGSPIIRLGSKSGVRGLFINESNIDAGTGYQAKLTPANFFVGNPTSSYIDFDATRRPELKISGEATSGAYVANGQGWKLGADGSAQFNNNLSAPNFQTNTIYAGSFDNLRDSLSVPGRVLPAGGAVYYLEGTTFSQTNSIDWTTDTGTYAYASPSKYGSVSLTPTNPLSFRKAFDFANGTIEGWINLGQVVQTQTNVASISYSGGNLVSLVVVPYNKTSTGQMMTSTYSSGTYKGASMTMKKIYFYVNGTIYNVADTTNAWAYFSISTRNIFFGNGSTVFNQAISPSLAPTGSGKVVISLCNGIQLSNFMTASGYSFTGADQLASFGAFSPWGQVPNSNIIITQAYNGLRLPWAINDPTTIVNGATYYNTTTNKLKTVIDGVWNTIPTISPTNGLAVSSTLSVNGVATFNSTVNAPEVKVTTSMLKPMGYVYLNGVTSYDFTQIPSWVQKITIVWMNVKTSATGFVLFQVGSGGGVMTTGYLGSASYATTAVGTSLYTTGFSPGANSGVADLRHGTATITKLSSTSLLFAGQQSLSNTPETGTGNGWAGTAGAMDTLRITTTTGTDTLTGFINVLYE